MTIRHAEPQDHARVVAVVDEWWGGRSMSPLLPRLFLDHFADTSLVVEDDGRLEAFLVGFLSPARPDEAYIHFVGVAPEQRGAGIGRMLYDRFFAEVREQGRSVVRCVTSPANEVSVAFHEALGFEVDRVAKDYDGPGEDRVLLVRRLT